MIENRPTIRSAGRRSVPLVWLLLIAFDVCAAAFTYAQSLTTHTVVDADQTTPVQKEVIQVQLEGDQNTRIGGTRFEAIDVFVDSGELPLAAYQFELNSLTAGVEIVGIEGGEHAAFAEPPYYDSKAMNGNRVILAAFNTGKELPKGKSRVARVHVQVEGPEDRTWQTSLIASATTDGQRIPASLSIAKAMPVQ